MKGKNLIFKVILFALILSTSGIMMAVMSNEKLMGSFGLPNLSAIFNQVLTR